MTTFDEAISNANVLIGDKNYTEAIIQFDQAIAKTTIPEQQIDILNAQGRLFLRQQKIAQAVDKFEESLKVHDSLSEEKRKSLIVNKATILNNLGVIAVKDNPKKAAKYHKEALTIFNEEFEKDPTRFRMHLANTQYSYGDASYQKGDYYNAKKQFKDAIITYQGLDKKDSVDAFIANAHYNLGNIFVDEDNVHDGRLNYTRALKIFRVLSDKQPEAFRSLVAATYNNLSVVSKTMLKYNDAIRYCQNALEQYELLVEQDRETFLPFYASTLNSLGIIYSEQHEVKDDYDSLGLNGFSGFGMLSADMSPDEKKDKQAASQKENAIKFYKKATSVYNELAEKQPEVYTHYLATAMHNLGILYDENGDFEEAAKHYSSALSIRRMLAEKQPKAFNRDVCVTLLNIVTMYQLLLEKDVDVKYRDKALELLMEIEERLAIYGESDEAILLSMRSDRDYFKRYFEKVNEESLDVFRSLIELDKTVQKITETAVPSEKLVIQQKIVGELKDLMDKYPKNERVIAELANACVDYSWLALRSNELQHAKDSIIAGYQIDPHSRSLKVNEAHLYLMRNEYDKAKEIYLALKEVHDDENEPFVSALEADLKILKNDGVYFPTYDIIGSLTDC